MSYVVKGHSVEDTGKPVDYYLVNNADVIVKGREVRSDNTDEYYHLSPVVIAKPTDDTLPLEKSVFETSPPTSPVDSLASSGEVTALLNLHVSPLNTAKAQIIDVTPSKRSGPWQEFSRISWREGQGPTVEYIEDRHPSASGGQTSISASQKPIVEYRDRYPSAPEIQSPTLVPYSRPQESPPSPPQHPPPYLSTASADTPSDASSSENSDASAGNNLIVDSDSDIEMLSLIHI